MFSRHDREDHPANVGRDCQRHAQVIDQMYERMDALVGRVMDAIDDDTVLMVLSDHGFCDFSRGMNVNTWLREEGYLCLQDDAAPGDYFAGVDWSRTRAYAFGLGGIYINRAGRESQGAVPPEEAAALRAEIAEKLRGMIDTDRDCRAIRDAYDCHQVFAGPYVDNGPDVIVGFEKGYRVSWETAVGRTDGPLFVDNTRYWSGDHCVDPSLVPGLFLSNQRFREQAPGIIDLAPTIPDLFGVPVPQYMDGKPLMLDGEPAQKSDTKRAPDADAVEVTV